MTKTTKTSEETERILRKNLTPEQYRAVVDESRHILCIACAGSGKSRTLAYKIAYLMSKGEKPESVVAFTFTEKAAESIKRRVAEALGELGLPENYIGAMFIGTLDSFCQKLLGDINAKYRQYDILDRNGLILFIMSRYPKIGLRNVQGRYFKDKVLPLADAWQTMNNENIDLSDIARSDMALFQQLSSLGSALKNDGYMDFSYAIRLAVQEIRNIPEQGNSHVARFKYLLVDEYQDINPVQEEFIRLLASRLDMLLVVGDDDQSIYGWRGADVQNILTFEERYQPVSTHRLLVNFRSTKAIVDGANEFIRNLLDTQRLNKDITSHHDGNIQDLRKLWFDSREEEAEWIASRIEELVGTKYVEKANPDGTEKEHRGLTYSDFAILLRSIHNEKGDNRDKDFAEALTRHNIPYRTSGEGGIFDRPYAVCILDSMEMLRKSGITRESASAFFDDHVIAAFPQADRDGFLEVMHKWNQNIHAPSSTARRKVYPQEFLHDLVNVFDVRSFDDEIALRDLGLFSRIILDVEKTYTSIDSNFRFAEMLNFISNIARNNYELEQVDFPVKDNAVSISSIHKVKGLEFPVVFIADLIRGRFPHNNAKYRGILPDEVMADAIRRDAYGTHREDEARLFYTAVTRAERCLYLTGSSAHRNLKRPARHSEFFDRFSPGIREDKGNESLAEKVPQQPRFDEGDFPTDYSTIKTYLYCPYAYKLATIYGYHAAVPELFGFGKTSHTILERLHQCFKRRPPTAQEVKRIVDENFMLKHVFPSKDPDGRPGSYERAKALVERIVAGYAEMYGDDFSRLRQDEARFELPAKGALITGSIDLLLKEDPERGVVEADVIDFKSMEIPDGSGDFDWRDMSVQVQLYSKAAREVIGENVETGYIHTLKDNRRTRIPVDRHSVDKAIEAVEWAVQGILEGDFPMRACGRKCECCDFRAMCARKRQPFRSGRKPPAIDTPTGPRDVAAFDLDGECEGQA